MSDPLRCLELFAGIGGLALAAHWAGIETAMVCEYDPFCRAILAKRFPRAVIHDDVRTLTGAIVHDLAGRIDIISGGFPCQPFSVVGRRRGKGDDRHLWPEMRRLIREIHPRFVVGENVGGFIGMGLDDVLDDLDAEGYETVPILFPARAVGAFHERYRTFIVARSLEHPGELVVRGARRDQPGDMGETAA